ncbi:hypothetical protein HZS54_06365 [Halosimplex pelagicum]|uniref:Uncharacterized protein n=2 Tax=Halosimplex pelagicum TaxID=869886 RepID=A0A7D5PAM6_9EURY|nr:hypothetical protein HZS54_06365 [Halosimplex pelagicum]
MEAVQQALRGLDVGSTEAVRILSWANSETPAIYDRDQTAYLVLGSYRDPYLRRVRAVSDRLNRRYGTYAFLIGDLSDIDLPRLPEFRVKFHITATLSDYVAAVFEQDAGGEINELGKLGETEYFEKAYALPRAYQWETEDHLSDERDVLAAGAQLMAATDIDDESKAAELEVLVDRANQTGIDISVDEVTTTLEEDAFEVPSYSWVHLNDFRLFELHGRCYPWTTEDELLEATDDLPGSPRPEWEQ